MHLGLCHTSEQTGLYYAGIVKHACMQLLRPAPSMIFEATGDKSDEKTISISGYLLMFMARMSAILLGCHSSESIWPSLTGSETASTCCPTFRPSCCGTKANQHRKILRCAYWQWYWTDCTLQNVSLGRKVNACDSKAELMQRV